MVHIAWSFDNGAFPECNAAIVNLVFVGGHLAPNATLHQ
jgi:hypothetical protein